MTCSAIKAHPGTLPGNRTRGVSAELTDQAIACWDGIEVAGVPCLRGRFERVSMKDSTLTGTSAATRTKSSLPGSQILVFVAAGTA
jgi:hypothetical protein